MNRRRTKSLAVSKAPKKEKAPPPSSTPAKTCCVKQKNKKIVAEVETDVGEITAAEHDQNKCIKEQQSPSNTKDTGKEIISDYRLLNCMCGEECTDYPVLGEWFKEPEPEPEPEKPWSELDDHSLLMQMIHICLPSDTDSIEDTDSEEDI